MIERKRTPLSATQRVEVWRRWKAGESLHAIGRALGKDYVVVHLLLKRHGGIAPAPRRRSPRALTLAEREDISRGIATGCSMRAIAQGLNARIHTKHQIRQIASSISFIGFANPVLVTSANTIVAGHGRVAAAKLLGMDRVPVIRLEGLSVDQIRACIIADNRDWYEGIVSGKIANVGDLAKQTRVSAAYIQRILPCALLSPKVSEAILSGQQRPRITLEELLHELPIRWLEQERKFLAAGSFSRQNCESLS
jgi:hypothetical protein